MLKMTVNIDCQYFYFWLNCSGFDLHLTLRTHCWHFFSLGFVLLLCRSDRTRRQSLFSHFSLGPAHQVKSRAGTRCPRCISIIPSRGRTNDSPRLDSTLGDFSAFHFRFLHHGEPVQSPKKGRGSNNLWPCFQVWLNKLRSSESALKPNTLVPSH